MKKVSDYEFNKDNPGCPHCKAKLGESVFSITPEQAAEYLPVNKDLPEGSLIKAYICPACESRVMILDAPGFTPGEFYALDMNAEEDAEEDDPIPATYRVTPKRPQAYKSSSHWEYTGRPEKTYEEGELCYVFYFQNMSGEFQAFILERVQDSLKVSYVKALYLAVQTAHLIPVSDCRIELITND